MRGSLRITLGVALVVAAPSFAQPGPAPQPERLVETPAGALALVPNGATLATSQGPTVVLWDRGTGKQRQKLTGHTAEVQTLAFSPDGALLVSASTAEVVVWDTKTGRRKTVIPAPLALAENHRGQGLPFVTFSPNGTLLAFGPDKGGVRLWDLRRDAPGQALEPARLKVTSAAFSPDGKTLAVGTGSGDAHGAVILYDVGSGTKQGAGTYAYAIYSRVLGVGFSAEGDRVWSAHLHGQVCWYDLAPKKMSHRRLLSGPATARAIIFAPGAEKLALATGNQLEIWDTRLWQRVRTLPDVTGPVAFAPDGKTVVADHQGVVKLWRLD